MRPQKANHLTMKLLRTLPLVAVLLFVRIPAAWSDDHVSPRAVLRLAERNQRGTRYHAEWVKPSRDRRFCTTRFSDSWPSFPKVGSFNPGDLLRIRLHKTSMPLEVEAYQWHHVDDEGYGRGATTSLPWLLEPKVAGGETRAWDVVVSTPTSSDHLYFGVSVYWRDEEECTSQPDLGSQGAGWAFHVKKG